MHRCNLWLTIIFLGYSLSARFLSVFCVLLMMVKYGGREKGEISWRVFAIAEEVSIVHCLNKIWLEIWVVSISVLEGGDKNVA